MTNIDPVQAAQAYTFAGQDVPWLIKHRAEHQPDKLALIWEPKDGATETWTYLELDEATDSLAAGLLAQGVKKGDRILIHTENCPETILTWYACAKLGAIGVVTNTRSVEGDIEYFADHTQAVIAITQPQFAALLASNAKTCRTIFVTDTNAGVPAKPEPIPDHCKSFDQLYGDASKVPVREAEPMLPAGIIYTSGTTSRPKAVVHTHANALWAGRTNTASMDYRSEDRYLAFLPLFHVTAMGWGVWGSLGVGATLVLQPKFSSSRFWEVIEKHQITHCAIVQFVLKAIASQPVPEQHSLRVLAMGVMRPDVGEWLKVRSFACWGMTEMVANATRSCDNQVYPINSIGKPLPGYTLAVVNPETGAYCPAGEAGELWVYGTRGVNIFLEYYKNEEANRKAFTDNGWFKTGDIVRLDAEGNLFFCDRDKDALKVGGENISAQQVEVCIREVPGVEDVAVVGKKHEMLDQVTVAFVIASALSDDQKKELESNIFAHCEEHLADFKRPRAVYFVDEFPKAAMDKLAKNKLRELADEMPAIE